MRIDVIFSSFGFVQIMLSGLGLSHRSFLPHTHQSPIPLPLIYLTMEQFIADLYASVAPPVKALKAIERIWLEVGESTTVSFAVEEHSFSFIGRDLKPRVEPGEFVIIAGELSSTITLVPSVGSVEL